MNYSYFQIKKLDREKKLKEIQTNLLIVVITGAVIVGFMNLDHAKPLNGDNNTKDDKILVQEEEKAPEPQILTIKRIVETKQREVSAYNVGDPNQTDDSPCIGASGVDICNLLDHGVCVYAANFVKLGTYLTIDGQECQVLDRMNSKYKNRVDIAMKLSEKDKAIKFGVKNLDVNILEN